MSEATHDASMVDPRLYRMVIEQTRDYALFLLDPEGRVASWNLGAQCLKGYAAQDIIGRHFSVFYPQEAVQRRWPEHELSVATREGRFEDEGWRLRKDGSRFWANVVITALRDEQGRLLGFSKITRDLTERKRNEEALRQSEERFRLLIDGIVDYAIFMLDPRGVVASWNAGAQRITGFTRDEVIGTHFSRFYVDEEVQASKPWLDLSRARRSGRAEDEAWRLRKDGTLFWARVALTPLYDADGQLRGFAKVTQDLTQRRQVEALEKAAKNVSEFIAMLAHELRNPLAPIRNAVEAMARLPAADPAQPQLRQMIDRQSAQLVRIIDDLLDITRITRGVISLRKSRVDLADVVRLAVETARPALDAAGHHLSVDCPDGELIVHGDAQRLAQLVGNLLNNAARYTLDGGAIAVKASSHGNHALLSVSDNGRGIEPEFIDTIFDMFVQGRAPVDRVGGGLGIGLALARKLAQLHGGTLSAASEGPGKGSQFVLNLPLLDASADAPRAAVGSDALPPGRTAPRPAHRRVLLVDDNEDAAGAIKALLEVLGHEAAVVHEGHQALEAVRAFRPDVVLLDIGLPDLTGYEVGRRLRDADPSLRIIALTGWGQPEDRQKTQQAGFDMHLVKPVDLVELQSALDDQEVEEAARVT